MALVLWVSSGMVAYSHVRRVDSVMGPDASAATDPRPGHGAVRAGGTPVLARTLVR